MRLDFKSISFKNVIEENISPKKVKVKTKSNSQIGGPKTKGMSL